MTLVKVAHYLLTFLKLFDKYNFFILFIIIVILSEFLDYMI